MPKPNPGSDGLLSSSNLRCCYTNAQGLRSKLSELSVRQEAASWDLIAITETWLPPEAYDAEFQLPGMSIIRRDRTSRGGGVALYYNTALTCEPIDLLNDGCPDALFCSLHLQGRDTCLVVVVYRPPNNPADWDAQLILTLQKALRAKFTHILIMGDFNTPSLCTNPFPQGTFDAQLRDLIESTPLYNHVRAPTRYRGQTIPSLLDLVLTNEELMVESVDILQPLGCSDHSVLNFSYTTYASRNDKPQHKAVAVTNYDKLDGLVQANDWSYLTYLPVEEAWNQFTHQMKLLTEAATEVKTLPNRVTHTNQWIKSRTRKWMTQRDHAWKIYASTPSKTTWEEYRSLRNQCVQLVREDKNTWHAALAYRFQENPKLLFKHVNSLRKVKHGVPPLQTPGGLTTSLQEAAEVLLKHYASSATVLPSGSYPPPDTHAHTPMPATHTNPVQSNPKYTHVIFTTAAVQQKLTSLRKYAAPGLDDITPRTLIRLAPVLAEPLSVFFQNMFLQGVTPEQWKQGVITPAYKGGNRSDPSNYRPITLLPILSKVMESVVADQLRQYLETSNLLSAAQHGFRKNRSCLTNLLLTRDSWTQILDQGGEVDAIYLDFSKAFDRVHHQTLIHKLSILGIGGPLLTWIQNYLLGRTVTVRISGTLSNKAHIPLGVPQGSVLGPLLFLILINDLPEVLSSPCQIFADDVKLWRPIVSDADRKALQTDLDELYRWSLVNRLYFNPQKCHILQLRGTGNRKYFIGSACLTTSTTERDLGVLIQDDLGTSSQCRKAANAANKFQALFRRAFGPTTRGVLRTLITTYIRPVTEYAVQSWSPWLVKDSQLLEQPQRRATKLAAGLRHLPYPDRLAEIGLYSAAYRRLRGDMILTYQILTTPNHPCNSLLRLAESHNLRGHRLKLAHQHSHLECRRHFFSLRVCRIWNSLPDSVIEAPTIAAFKQRLDIALETLRFSTL